MARKRSNQRQVCECGDAARHIAHKALDATGVAVVFTHDDLAAMPHEAEELAWRVYAAAQEQRVPGQPLLGEGHVSNDDYSVCADYLVCDDGERLTVLLLGSLEVAEGDGLATVVGVHHQVWEGAA